VYTCRRLIVQPEQLEKLRQKQRPDPGPEAAGLFAGAEDGAVQLLPRSCLKINEREKT